MNGIIAAGQSIPRLYMENNMSVFKNIQLENMNKKQLIIAYAQLRDLFFQADRNAKAWVKAEKKRKRAQTFRLLTLLMLTSISTALAMNALATLFNK